MPLGFKRVCRALPQGRVQLGGHLEEVVLFRVWFRGAGVPSGVVGRAFLEFHAEFLDEGAVFVFVGIFLGEEFVAGEDGVGQRRGYSGAWVESDIFHAAGGEGGRGRRA